MSGTSRHTIRSEIAQNIPKVASVKFVKNPDGTLIPGDLNEKMNKLFKSNVFSDFALRMSVPKDIVKSLYQSIREGTSIDRTTSDVVAQALKEWAVARGCTHYNHWFQPLRSVTAEKHDSFVDFFGQERDLHMEFKGEQLLRGEPDASSFPGGGLRATHEARGYTIWDPTSPPFIIEGTNGNTLFIPTMFLSWTGEALDVKTPLKRSIAAISEVAVEMLHLMGDKDVKSISCSMGPEQEFFLIDRAFYNSRPDLVASGKTVQGAPSAKGQQLEDHYFAAMPERVLACIQDVEIELWKLGVPTKTRHNEVAPSQYEMAPIFEECNIASDHNLLVMEVLNRVALRHNLVALLHEKPFKGVNGSGKHNNWSMCTDTGINLLNPTEKPHDNIRFQAFLAACIKAVDDHSDLLRCSVAYSGNDHRLGAQEAPPAIMSVYLGEVLDILVNDLVNDYEKENPHSSPNLSDRPHRTLTPQHSIVALGAAVGTLHRDRTDRNRTSPFAFTGNKFEFRAPGSSSHVGSSCTILNLIVAAAIRDMIADIKENIKKEKSAGRSDEEAATNAVRWTIGRTLKRHKRVIFNGDGYSEAWVKEAARRGLLNLRETVIALNEFSNEKNVGLFTSFNVLTKAEVLARSTIQFHAWTEQTQVEARALHGIVNTHIVSAGLRQQTQLATSIKSLRDIDSDFPVAEQIDSLKELSTTLNTLIAENRTLAQKLSEVKHYDSAKDTAIWVRENINPVCVRVRAAADHLETLVDDSFWTLPKYQEVLFFK